MCKYGLAVCAVIVCMFIVKHTFDTPPTKAGNLIYIKNDMQEYTAVVDVQFRVTLKGRTKIAASGIVVRMTDQLRKDLAEVGRLNAWDSKILSIDEVK